MLLIITNSTDSTVDLLLQTVVKTPAFRFNIDLWPSYELIIDVDGFSISDPTGRSITEAQTTSCYWRKPVFEPTVPPMGVPTLDTWLQTQWKYAAREIWNVCRNAGKARLVEAGAENRFGKVMQMRLARKYFPVPSWSFTRTSEVSREHKDVVCKSFVTDCLDEGKVFYTRAVNPAQLDPRYPWFLQNRVPATHDMTIVYVAGRCFGFRLDRSLLEGADWRVDINRVHQQWEDYLVDNSLAERVQGFMDEARLSYGRLDFLLHDGEAFFLEVNPNGQYAWLDSSGAQGMLKAVVEELTCESPRKPIPPATG